MRYPSAASGAGRLGAGLLCDRAIDYAHGLFHLTGKNIRYDTQTVVDGLLNGYAVFEGWFLQYPVDNFWLAAGMADAQAQPPVILAAQLGVHVTQTVVAGMPTALLQFYLAGI